MDDLLRVEQLQISFDTPAGRFPAVDGVSFAVQPGKTLCIVGESGSGKSVTSLGIMRLLQSPPARCTGGSIWFEGENLLQKREKELRRIRGSQISMIFQEPMTSLNPVLTIGFQVAESLRAHQRMDRAAAWKQAAALLQMVGITDAEKRLKEYPHQMSGGMRQRVMIAIALACSPKLLIADEPTTALDVTIQAQILRLLKELRQKTGMAIILITHDLGVVAEMADEVVVMYAGKVMECGSVHDIFEHPSHPYTKGLMDCIPKLSGQRKRLTTIEGTVPKLGGFPAGCRFSTRCPYCTDQCHSIQPEMMGKDGHFWFCHLAPEQWEGET